MTAFVFSTQHIVYLTENEFSPRYYAFASQKIITKPFLANIGIYLPYGIFCFA